MACAGGPDTINTNSVLALDAANKVSYPGTGTGWYNLNSSITSGSVNLNGIVQSGSLKNGPTFNGGNGGSIVFDGTDDYALIIFSNSSNLINDPTTNGGIISFSMWVNVTSNTIGGYIIASGAQTTSTGMWLATQNGSPQVGIRTNTKYWYRDITAADFPLNTWINWAITCDNTTMYVYKNGTSYTNTTSTAISVSSQFSTLSIGVPNNVLNNYLGNFKIANLMFYNRALSATEVLQNYNVTKTRFGL